MARRTTKTAAFSLPHFRITADALPGVNIFSIAALYDGSLDALLRQHAVLASYGVHRCPNILRAELHDGCELTDQEIDEVVATGVLPEIGIGWMPAMAGDVSRTVDAQKRRITKRRRVAKQRRNAANLRALADAISLDRKSSPPRALAA